VNGFWYKIATKLSSKFLAKAAAGYVPVAGAILSGGINFWLLSNVSDAAEKYYLWKAGRLSDWTLE
jgi:hypothetical protein